MKLNFVRSLLAEQFEAHKITDFTSLDHFLRHYVRAGTFSERHASTVLKDSIQRFETEFKISFYKELLPKIIQWSVCDEPLYVDLLEQGIDAETKLSETEIRFLLANAFFGNLTTFHELNAKSIADTPAVDSDKEDEDVDDDNNNTSTNNNNNDVSSSSSSSSAKALTDSKSKSSFQNQFRQFGEVNFCKLYDRRLISEAEERVMCLLAYFAEADDCSDTQYVTFSRVSAKSLPDWSKCEKPVARERTIVHDGLMEAVMLSSDRPAFVDFANKNLHIHQVIPSCTQEEILFSCAPSCFVSMLITETLLPNEAVVIRNVRRYCLYEGYLDTFKFTKVNPRKDHRFDVVAIDACTHNHFSREMNERDMCKMFLACNAAKCLSTGNWGCGIFMGDDSHKFVQQVIVANYCDTKLYFSANGERGQRMRVLHDAMIESKLNVGQLYDIVVAYDPRSRREKKFAKYFLNVLRPEDGLA